LKFFINGQTFVVRDGDATSAIRISNDILSDVLKKCKEENAESFYPVFLMTMRILCQNQLDLLGTDGVVALLAHAEYVGRPMPGPDDEKQDIEDVVKEDGNIPKDFDRLVPIRDNGTSTIK